MPILLVFCTQLFCSFTFNASDGVNITDAVLFQSIRMLSYLLTLPSMLHLWSHDADAVWFISTDQSRFPSQLKGCDQCVKGWQCLCSMYLFEWKNAVATWWFQCNQLYRVKFHLFVVIIYNVTCNIIVISLLVTWLIYRYVLSYTVKGFVVVMIMIEKWYWRILSYIQGLIAKKAVPCRPVVQKSLCMPIYLPANPAPGTTWRCSWALLNTDVILLELASTYCWPISSFICDTETLQICFEKIFPLL